MESSALVADVPQAATSQQNPTPTGINEDDIEMPCISAPKMTEQNITVELVEKSQGKEIVQETKKEETGDVLDDQGQDAVEIDVEQKEQ